MFKLIKHRRYKLLRPLPAQRALLSCLKRLAERPLVHAFRNGDERAFEKVYSQFQKPILSFIMGKVNNSSLAEELTQEVFLKAHRFRESFDTQYEISTWLWTIARNTVSDWYRKDGTNAHLHEGGGAVAEEIPCRNPHAEALLLQSAEREALMMILSPLTELQKSVLMMSLIYQLPYKVIAKRLNLSISAVKCLAHRARQAIDATGLQALLGSGPLGA